MTAISFSCPLCGHAFDPSANAGCASCPLSAGCRTVCCPNCGHSTVDPRDSRLARWAASALARLGGRRAASPPADLGARPLSAAPAPQRLRIIGLPAGEGGRGARLRAYGLAAGVTIELLQQRPVTLIRVEQTELAIEADLLAGVLVEPAP